MYYVINGYPLWPLKNNNQKVEEDLAVWPGTFCYVKISLISLDVSAIFTVETYPNVTKFHDGKSRPVYDKIIQEQIH